MRGGEAHFDVFKDTGRPFVVVAHGVEIRAVGTAFSVGLGASSVEVLVTEGKVAVENPVNLVELPSAIAVAPPLATVTAGNRVVVELATPMVAAPPVEPISTLELKEKLAWRLPRLNFSAAPLAEVIEVFNRHSHLRIALADPSLANLQISGLLRADNADSLLEMLELEFGIQSERVGENGIRLKPASAPAR